MTLSEILRLSIASRFTLHLALSICSFDLVEGDSQDFLETVRSEIPEGGDEKKKKEKSSSPNNLESVKLYREIIKRNLSGIPVCGHTLATQTDSAAPQAPKKYEKML